MDNKKASIRSNISNAYNLKSGYMQATRSQKNSIKEQLTNTYDFWKKRNVVMFTFILIFQLIYFTVLLVVTADAHWSVATKANPIYINFNQLTYIGIWARCNVYYTTQDGSGAGVRWQCNSMNPTIQVLPAYLIYTRIMIMIAIMLSFLAFCASILIFPYVPYGYQNKRKLTLACGFPAATHRQAFHQRQRAPSFSQISS